MHPRQIDLTAFSEPGELKGFPCAQLMAESKTPHF